MLDENNVFREEPIKITDDPYGELDFKEDDEVDLEKPITPKLPPVKSEVVSPKTEPKNTPSTCEKKPDNPNFSKSEKDQLIIKVYGEN